MSVSRTVSEIFNSDFEIGRMCSRSLNMRRSIDHIQLTIGLPL